MTHEDFLEKVKLGATHFKYGSDQDDVLKLIKIIETLKFQRDREYAYDTRTRTEIMFCDNSELDEIVGME